MLVESMYQLDTSGEYVENDEPSKSDPRAVTGVTSAGGCAAGVGGHGADRV